MRKLLILLACVAQAGCASLFVVVCGLSARPPEKMMHLLQRLSCALLVLAAPAVLAQNAAVLGRSIHLSLPPGYCSLSTSDQGRVFMRNHAERFVKTGELLEYAVPCEQLTDGTSARWTRWFVVIAPPGPKGKPELETRPLAQYLAAFGAKALDVRVANRTMDEGSAKHARKVTSADFAGNDGKAAYWVTSGEGRVPGQTGVSRISGAIAATVVNQVVLSVGAYGVEGENSDALAIVRARVQALHQ